MSLNGDITNHKTHSEKFTLPVLVLLEVQEVWRISVSPSSDPKFSFIYANPHVIVRHYEDAFKVRSEFLDIKSPQEALDFFQRYGPFELLPKQRRAQYIRWSLIQKTQSEFTSALTGDAISARLFELVFNQPIAVELRFRAVTPELLKGDSSWTDDAGIVDCKDVVSALRTSIFLTRRSRFRWKRCARKGCNKLFELDTKRDKIYCRTECGHLEAVNAYNARKKNSKRRKHT